MIKEPTIVITDEPSGPLNVTQGQTHTLKYTYTDEDGNTYDSDSNIDVTWDQRDDNILTVGDTSGKVTPVKAGKTTVTVTGPDGTKSKPLEIKIIQDPTLKITNPISSLKVGKTHDFGYLYTDKDGKDYSSGKVESWKSSDTTRATVGSSDGIVTSIGLGGTITIDLSVEGLTASTDIAVKITPTIQIDTKGQTGFNPKVPGNDDKQWGYIYTDENGLQTIQGQKVKWQIDQSHINLNPLLRITVKNGHIKVGYLAKAGKTHNVSVMLERDSNVKDSVKIEIGDPCVEIIQKGIPKVRTPYKLKFEVKETGLINSPKIPDSKIDKYTVKVRRGAEYVKIHDDGRTDVLKSNLNGPQIKYEVTVRLKNGMKSQPSPKTFPRIKE